MLTQCKLESLTSHTSKSWLCFVIFTGLQPFLKKKSIGEGYTQVFLINLSPNGSMWLWSRIPQTTFEFLNT